MSKDPDNYLAIHLQSLSKQLDTMNSRIGTSFDKLDTLNSILHRNTEIVDQTDKRSSKIEASMESFQSEIRRNMIESEKRITEVESKVQIQLAKFEHEIETIKGNLEPIKIHVDTVQKLTGFFTTSSGMLRFIGLLLGFILSSYGLYGVVLKFIGK